MKEFDHGSLQSHRIRTGGDPAVVAEQTTGRSRVDDRRVLNGIFFILRVDMPWADLPVRSAPYTTVYNRFNRVWKAGVWDSLMDAIITAHDGKVPMIASTSMRVYQQAAAQKNRLGTLASLEVVEN